MYVVFDVIRTTAHAVNKIFVLSDVKGEQNTLELQQTRAMVVLEEGRVKNLFISPFVHWNCSACLCDLGMLQHFGPLRVVRPILRTRDFPSLQIAS